MASVDSESKTDLPQHAKNTGVFGAESFRVRRGMNAAIEAHNPRGGADQGPVLGRALIFC